MSNVRQLWSSWMAITLVVVAAFGVAGSRSLHEVASHGATAATWSDSCGDGAHMPTDGKSPAAPVKNDSHHECFFCLSKTTSLATVIAQFELSFLTTPDDLGVVALHEDAPVLVDSAHPRDSRGPPIA